MNGGPTDLRFRAAGNRAAERSGDELATEADTQHRDVRLDGGAYPLQFWSQPVANAAVIPGAPRGPHGNDKVVARNIREFKVDVRIVVVLFGHDHDLVNIEAALPKALPHWTAGSDVVVLHQESSQLCTFQVNFSR